MIPTARAILLTLLLATAASAAPISSQTLGELDAADYTVRQGATQRLLAQPRLAPEEVLSAYRQAATVEQRHRLLDIARHVKVRQMVEEHFPLQRVGAIGISSQGVGLDQLPHLDQPAVVVMQTFPGFPAYAALRPGDLILAVDSHRLSEPGQAEVTNQFIRLIQEKRTGDHVSLTLRRDGRQLKVKLQLANLQALNQIYEAPHPVLRQPFRDQWRRYYDRLLDAGPQPELLKVESAPPPRQDNARAAADSE